MVDEDEELSTETVGDAVRHDTAPGGSRVASCTNVPISDCQGPGNTKSRLGPNVNVPEVPRLMTKSALSKAAHTKEELRKEFLVIQDDIKNSDMVIPFVFYDGTNVPGGSCGMKKGDAIWLFLDRARKVGAELGVGGADTARRQWARVSVDDLMFVKHEIIVPHHYDFYYFIMNSIKGPRGPLFDFAQRPPDHSKSAMDTSRGQVEADCHNIRRVRPPDINTNDDTAIEGANHDPAMTKVVDRRWYERNKHIYPASVWEEFDPTKDYEHDLRKDTQGNPFFLR